MKLINNINVSTSKLLQLERDAQLINQGYKIHYVVDAYDILLYCFPKGIEGTGFLDPIVYENNLMGYHYLFYEINDINKPIILNEYLGEINRNRIRFINNRLKNKRTYLKNIVLDLKNQDKDFQRLTDSEKYKDLVNDIHYIMSSAIFNSDSIKTFSDLFSNRILYRKPSSFDGNEEAEIVFKAFENSKLQTTSYLDLFDSWLNKNTSYFVGKKTSDIIFDFETIKRDFKSIERIVKANQIISQSKYPKNIFLYFSSASRTKAIINSPIFQKWYKSNAILNDEYYSIWRNNTDAIILFLLNLNSKGSQEDKNKNILSNISKLLDLSKLSNSSQSPSLDEFMQMFQQSKVHALTIDTIRTKLLLNSELKKRAELAINNLDKKLTIDQPSFKLSHVIDKLTIQNIREADGLISRLRSFNDLKDEMLSINKSFSDFLRQLILQGGGVRNKPGQDYITGTFHKLPILLFHKKIFEGRNIKKYPYQFFDEVLVELLKSESLGEDDSVTFIKNLEKIVKGRSLHSQKDELEGGEKLIMIFMMMLVDDDPNIDQRVLEELEFSQIIFKNISFNRPDTKNIHSYENNIQVELLYFKTWILRRCKKYEQSKELCLTTINIFPNESCRFLHGLALAEFCFFHEYRSPINRMSKEVKKLIQLTLKTISSYKSQTKSEDDYLIQGTLMSLNNLLSYLMVHDLFNHILDSKKISTNKFSEQISKINKIRESITSFSDSRYELHFEVTLTQYFINVLKDVVLKINGNLNNLMNSRKLFKIYVQQSKREPYINYDLKIIDLVTKFINNMNK